MTTSKEYSIDDKRIHEIAEKLRAGKAPVFGSEEFFKDLKAAGEHGTNEERLDELLKRSNELDGFIESLKEQIAQLEGKPQLQERRHELENLLSGFSEVKRELDRRYVSLRVHTPVRVTLRKPLKVRPLDSSKTKASAVKKRAKKPTKRKAQRGS